MTATSSKWWSKQSTSARKKYAQKHTVAFRYTQLLNICFK